MAILSMADMVRVFTNTSGLATYQLGSTPSGFLAPLTKLTSGSRSTWKCESLDGVTWEIFEGTITAGSPPTITRDRVILNSAGLPAGVNWSDNATKRISQVLTADWINAFPAASGYYKLPHGIIEQWGTATTGTGGIVAVTFPVAFPTNTGPVFPSLIAGTGAAYTLAWNTPSLTGVNLVAQNTSGTGVSGLSLAYRVVGW